MTEKWHAVVGQSYRGVCLEKVDCISVILYLPVFCQGIFIFVRKKAGDFDELMFVATTLRLYVYVLERNRMGGCHFYLRTTSFFFIWVIPTEIYKRFLNNYLAKSYSFC